MFPNHGRLSAPAHSCVRIAPAVSVPFSNSMSTFSRHTLMTHEYGVSIWPSDIQPYSIRLFPFNSGRGLSVRARLAFCRLIAIPDCSNWIDPADAGQQNAVQSKLWNGWEESQRHTLVLTHRPHRRPGISLKFDWHCGGQDIKTKASRTKTSPHLSLQRWCGIEPEEKRLIYYTSYAWSSVTFFWALRTCRTNVTRLQKHK